MMITYVNHRQITLVEGNRKVYICCLVAFAMLVASPMRAANPLSTPVPEQAERATLVVRADPATGRLVRKVVSARPMGTRAAAARAEIANLVDQSARAHDVDPLLVYSMIRVESNYNPNAISPKGAEGLMQLTPATARMLGVGDSFDPGQNIEGGVKYLKYLQSVYKDDRLALAAYNAGPGAVEKYKSIPPYPETQNYVNQVGKEYSVARQAAAAAISAEPVINPEEPQPSEEKHPKLEQFIDQDGRLHLRTVQ
jgi:soluble lytic murein transglycosylase-like protein